MTTSSLTAAPAGQPTTEASDKPRPWLVAVPQKPVIVCLAWCEFSAEEHIEELVGWEGMVIHESRAVEFGHDHLCLSQVTFPDGTPEPSIAGTVRVMRGDDIMSIDDAIGWLRQLLASVEGLASEAVA